MSDEEYGRLVKHSGPQGFGGMVLRNPDKIGREEIPGAAATSQAASFDNRPALPAERQPGRGWIPPAQRAAAGELAFKMGGRGGATTGEPSFARRRTPGTDPLRDIFRTDRGPRTPVDPHTYMSGYAGGQGGPYTQSGRGGATSLPPRQCRTPWAVVEALRVPRSSQEPSKLGASGYRVNGIREDKDQVWDRQDSWFDQKALLQEAAHLRP